MKAIEWECRRLERDIKRMAEMTVRTVEAFRSSMTPDRVDQYQTALRADLLWAEGRIKQLTQRKTTRSARLKSRFGTQPWWADLIGKHLKLLVKRDSLWSRYRSILRQTGDCLAWIVLREEPRILAPLFAKKTHHINTGVGPAGEVHIASAAHAQGKFIVLENDLTRALGVGDLTVVRADGRWLRPISYEIKSSGRFIEGAHINIGLTAAVGDSGPDADLHKEFSESLVLLEDLENVSPAPPAKQKEELKQSAELYNRLWGRVSRSLPAADSSLWEFLDQVGLKALSEGGSYSIADVGVAYVGVRALESDDPVVVMKNLMQELQTSGFNSDCKSITSTDIQTHDWISSYVPPIALWHVSESVRVKCLADDLWIACIYNPEIWARALELQGIALRVDGAEWEMTFENKTARLDLLSVNQLQYGFGFAGISPVEFAKTVREAFEHTAA